ncbi:MAG: hypothetical protein KIS85_06405 [Anaerolineales bacterium]|nr:hypothetical protein [Anaerolineales bacterium]
MDDHEESGGTLVEPGEPVSGEDLARETGLDDVSPEAPRQPASRGRTREEREAGRLAEQIEQRIEEAIERRWQSAKDRRLGRLEDEVRELRLRLARREGEAAASETPPPAPRASHIIQPGGGGLPPAPDLRAEYEAQVAGLRPGDLAGLMELKRRFRARGLEVY